MSFRHGLVSTCLLAVAALGAHGCAEETDTPEATSLATTDFAMALGGAEKIVAAAGAPEIGPRLIHTFAPNSCVAVASASHAFGTRLIQWTCNGGAEQEWYFMPVGAGDEWMIRNKNSGLCIGVAGGAVEDGAQLIQWPCSYANANERWSWFREPGQVNSIFVNNYTGKVMSVSGANPQRGANILQWEWHDGIDQIFAVFSPVHAKSEETAAAVGGDDEDIRVGDDEGIRVVDGDRFRLRTFANACVGVSGGSTAPGARLIQWTCDDSNNQLWVADYIGATSWFRLRNTNSDLCVGVNNGSHAHGEPLIQWPCSASNTNERWKLVASPSGSGVRLVNYATGQSMAVGGAVPYNGAKIIQWDTKNVAEQYFYPY